MARATRHDGRRANELRPVKIETGYVPPADGSCLIELGRTRVICTASFVEGAPFDGRQLQAMLRLARGGIRKLIVAQEQAIRKMK